VWCHTRCSCVVLTFAPQRHRSSQFINVREEDRLVTALFFLLVPKAIWRFGGERCHQQPSACDQLQRFFYYSSQCHVDVCVRARVCGCLCARTFSVLFFLLVFGTHSIHARPPFDTCSAPIRCILCGLMVDFCTLRSPSPLAPDHLRDQRAPAGAVCAVHVTWRYSFHPTWRCASPRGTAQRHVEGHLERTVLTAPLSTDTGPCLS
jgi:hypothetical protein